MGIYKMSETPVADAVRDINTRMADVDTLEAGVKGITSILRSMNDQRQKDLESINANFKSIDKQLKNRPVASVASKLPAAGHVAKCAAQGAMYYGPRTSLFLVVTIISIAIAAIFYSGQFEQPEVATAAWMAIYACAGAFVPSAALTWITRRR